MPIKPEHRALYPANWRAIRAQVLKRAGDRCEECNVSNYAVGYRDEDGSFVRAGGNKHWDEAGIGLLSHKDARELAEYANEWEDADRRYIVIVLTIAHLDHDPTRSELSNLKALCQRCHLRYDIGLHQRNAAATRKAKLGNQELFS